MQQKIDNKFAIHYHMLNLLYGLIIYEKAIMSHRQMAFNKLEGRQALVSNRTALVAGASS